MKSSPLAHIRGLAFALLAACACLISPRSQAQPQITGTCPDGQFLFEATNSLEISATSGTTITSLSVSLLETNLDGIGSSNYLTSGHGLTITTVGNAQVASPPLQTNYYYKAFITVVDSSGTVTNSIAFDTIAPAYIFESEDYDYGGGKF